MNAQDANLPAVQSQNSTPTLAQLEDEIKFHISQISQNIIEIGMRLIQAKSLVKHGEWSNWLETNFSLSQQTARRFMQVAERFSKTRIDTRFNSTQMIALLSLPDAEETEKFIEQKASEGTPVENMTVKTLRKEIKQWKSKSTSEDKVISVPQEHLSETQLYKQESSTDTVSAQTNFAKQSVPSSSLDFEVMHVEPKKQDEQTYSQTLNKLPPLPGMEPSNPSENFTLSPRWLNSKPHHLDVLFKVTNELVIRENLKQYIIEYASGDEECFYNDAENLFKVIDIIREVFNEGKKNRSDFIA